jgi:hypothetical protein
MLAQISFVQKSLVRGLAWCLFGLAMQLLHSLLEARAEGTAASISVETVQRGN